MTLSRRSYLASLGVAATGATAGCLSGAGLGDEPDGYGAFFALQDFTQQVVGEGLHIDSPVETGEMGHGWSPDGDLVRDVASGDLFVYIDTPEFAWAQDVADGLERDYEHIAVIDAMAAVTGDLLPFDVEPVPDPDDIGEVPFRDVDLEFDHYDYRTDEVLGYWHPTGDPHWHGGIPAVEVEGTVPVGIVLEDTDGNVIPLGSDEQYQIDARVVDGADQSVVAIDSAGDHVQFHGEATGSTEIVIQIREGDEIVYETENDPLTVNVMEDIDGGADEFHDPHAWVDPVLAQDMVWAIADGLETVYPDRAASIESNAAAYVDRLETVDQEFQELTDNAKRDVAVFVGHDSFQYIEHRYGFELKTPVGISPDASESFGDIADLVELIDEENIDTILYDPFESPNPMEELPDEAAVILDESPASNAEPLTPISGTTGEWADRGWGYVEQMREINIPSLRMALNE